NYKGAPTDGSAWVDNNEVENFNTENQSYSAKNDEKSPYSVLRGGSWLGDPDYCRSAFRSFDITREDRDFNSGFRLVCVSGRTG
ncbi:SUMF1/EgtB/PvdO family nonheme iron enzyme, partial [Moorena sp. SIO3H5]|uniref:SUMF1/EgtB/PvdO family nonheme iron enzyme n=1 Tax=Moorena sp. SIO3H5 TaxID=2607834 RepID=UPI0013BE6711